MDERLLAQTRAGYDAAAAAYAENLPDTGFEASIDMAMIDHFVAQLPAAATVLDAGCGTGRMLAYVHERDASMVLAGADLSANMLAHAREREPSAACSGPGASSCSAIKQEQGTAPSNAHMDSRLR